MDEDAARAHYIVRISVPDERGLRALRRGGAAFTSVESLEDGGVRVGAVLDLEQIGRLVDAGFAVLVAENARASSMPEIVGFQTWLPGMLDDVDAERKRR